MIYMPGVGGLEGGTPTPRRGRCMPYSDRTIGQHIQVVLGVGSAFDNAPHHLPLARATGRVSFSEGVPQHWCGSGLHVRSTRSARLAMKSEWLPSLGFTAGRLTLGCRSATVMSDKRVQNACHRPGGLISSTAGPLHVHREPEGLGSLGSTGPENATPIVRALQGDSAWQH